MALIKCAECQTEMSDKAAACPKCGAPKAIAAAAPAKSWSTGKVLVVGLLIIVVIGAMSELDKSGGGAPATAWAPSKEDIANQPARSKLIDKMGGAGLWSKIGECETIEMCVWVRAPFYALDIDKKRDAIQLVWTYHSVEQKRRILTMRLRDAQSGRDVGIYEREKLTMK